MADLKISQLSAVSEVQGTDVFPTVSGLATMKASAAQIKTYVTESLNVNDSAVAGSYVTAVSEANGVISVTREAADVKPTANSTKMLTSGGAKAALDEKQNTLTFDNTPTAGSNNPVKSGGVYTEVNSLKETLTNYVKDTGVKNLYVGSPSFDGYVDASGWTKQSETYNGHEVYKRSDPWRGAYVLLDLPLGTYTFSVSVKTSNSSNVAIYALVSGSTTGVVSPNAKTGITTTTNWQKVSFTFEVTTAGTVAIRIEKTVSDGDIYISEYQLEIGSTATDYEPYAKGNQQLTQETTGIISNDFTNGAVNLLKNTLITLVDNGVTFTHNSDGTVTANGTATANCIIEIGQFTGLSNVFLSGCPSGGDLNSTYNLQLRDVTTSTWLNWDLGNGVQANGLDSSHTYSVYLIVRSGYTASNKVFKPMITLADMPNSDYNHYVPYAKSNKELTDELTVKVGTITATDPTFSVVSVDIRQYGRVVTVNGYAEHITAAADTVTQIATLSGVSMPIKEIRAIGGVAAHAYNAPTKIAYINISSSTGNIFVRCTEAFNDQSIYLSISYIV